MIDYAREINASRAGMRRRRGLAWAGIGTGLVLGAVGMGSLFALSTGGMAVVVLVALGWFWWSVNILK